MPLRTKPCGTHAAAIFHKRHGEPVDDACAAAHARYRLEASRRERANAPLDLCTGCDRWRPIRAKRRG
ncbi:hypothetical protein [Spirillospora sp. NBC_01491]|uniref:hypothetical protein n=1 Tax=Spirillospora sp. NBC_01491 TaxID=2976007 RepID=UPI002E329A07|nr:hypothetical protein [Spirillospora sp. NBC_01491]